MANRTCSIEGCDRPTLARGWCSTHYTRWRKHGDPGVRGVVAKPTESSFGTELDDYIWKAETRTQSESSGGHDEWSDFSFGEPSIVRLSDGTFLAAIWCIQPSGSGIRYVKLKMIDG